MTCWDIIWPQIYVKHEPKRIFLLHLPSKHKKNTIETFEITFWHNTRSKNTHRNET